MSETYPVAETFLSIQGEGHWVGTPTFFIRLAGCNVGRYVGARPELGPAKIFPAREADLLARGVHSYCTAWDGTQFCCDTNYHRAYTTSVEEMVSQIHSTEHVCITGGEPFLHNLLPLLNALLAKGVSVQIETSGTLPFPWDVINIGPWITCSPKAGFDGTNAVHVDEWKFVVGPETRPGDISSFLAEYEPDGVSQVYIQPLNGVGEVWQRSVEKCLTILQGVPSWKLSAQLHKYLGVR